ncbi:unnamed protein product [Pleuronectes platessa]|uniref:Uncharacterized protein n=1 Tax=Pleuronectes platessa TaxID=8262 RepID=A0A9N7TPD2_PLEPL|nr:unnamed protein product [Pleuronectes platessa]
MDWNRSRVDHLTYKKPADGNFPQEKQTGADINKAFQQSLLFLPSPLTLRGPNERKVSVSILLLSNTLRSKNKREERDGRRQGGREAEAECILSKRLLDAAAK